MLTAAQLELLLQQLPAPGCIPLQAAEQLIGLLEQVFAAQGYRRAVGIRSSAQVAQAAQVAHQIGERGAAVVASALHGRAAVLVHCSDGWDRTAQLAALAQVLVDPHCRTFDGFAAPSVRGNPNARQAWAVDQVRIAMSALVVSIEYNCIN